MVITERDYLDCFYIMSLMKRKKFVKWILSQQAIKFHEPNVNSFHMCKLLIKIKQSRLLLIKIKYVGRNIFTRFFQQVLSLLFIRNLYHGQMNYFDTFLFSEEKSEPIKRVKIIHFANHSPPCKYSYIWTIYYQFSTWTVS